MIEDKKIYFSIIIPTFNSAATLQKCLDSVIQQTYTNFEILIIDGVSTDNTLEIARQFNDNRINIISEPDQGIYDAMNKGIIMAKGEWLYFLGSDDELYKNNVLNDIYKISLATKYKIIYGNVKIRGNAGWANDGDIYDGEFTLKKLLEKNICHQAIFYNRKIICFIGFYKLKYKIWSDWDFNLRTYSKYKFLYTNTIIASFEGGNTSFRKTDEVFLNDRWIIIYDSFKWELYKNEFTKHLIKIKNSIRENKNYNLFDRVYVKTLNRLNNFII